jgi:hypothetical protein
MHIQKSELCHNGLESTKSGKLGIKVSFGAESRVPERSPQFDEHDGGWLRECRIREANLRNPQTQYQQLESYNLRDPQTQY